MREWRVQDYRIVFYGIDHEDYFQGHGISNSKWKDCACGIGNSNQEALNDALEQLAMSEWDVQDLEKNIRDSGRFPTDKPDCLDEYHHYYVGLNVL